MNSLMPKKSEILQRFEIDKKTSFFSIKDRDGYQITEVLKIPLFSQIKRMEIIA